MGVSLGCGDGGGGVTCAAGVFWPQDANNIDPAMKMLIKTADMRGRFVFKILFFDVFHTPKWPNGALFWQRLYQYRYRLCDVTRR